MVYFTDPGKCATWCNLGDAIDAQSYPEGVEAFDFTQFTAITELVQGKMTIQNRAIKGDFNATKFLEAKWSKPIREELDASRAGVLTAQFRVLHNDGCRQVNVAAFGAGGKATVPQLVEAADATGINLQVEECNHFSSGNFVGRGAELEGPGKAMDAAVRHVGRGLQIRGRRKTPRQRKNVQRKRGTSN
jgi:hypothetical protein